MATQTPKLKLVKPSVSDYVNINDINGNMDKIEELTHITKSGTAPGKYSKVDSTTVLGNLNWYYQKTNDGIVRAWACHTATNLKCDKLWDDIYRSGYVQFIYPSLGQTKIIYRSAWVSTLGDYVNEIMSVASKPDKTTYDTIRLYNHKSKETKAQTKYIYLHFVATWA